MAARTCVSLLGGLLVLLLACGAWGAVEVTMEDRVEVFRGNSTQLICIYTSDEGPGGLIFQWFYVPKPGERQRIYYEDATKRQFERNSKFTDRSSVTKSTTETGGQVVLTIEEVSLKDELEFICLINCLTDGVGEGRTMLRVFETPQLPTIEPVQNGISVTEAEPSKIGSCEVNNGFPQPNITWYRNLHPLLSDHKDVEVIPTVTTESTGLYSVQSELKMRVTKEDKDAQFYCEITYYTPGGTRMTETKKIQIDVFYPSTSLRVWVESPKGLIKEGDTLEVLCQGDGHNPSEVMTIAHDMVTEDSSRLLVENVTRLYSGNYECSSLDLDGSDTIYGNTTVFINFLDPAVVVPKEAVVPQGENLEATCNALSSLRTHTAWFKDGIKIHEGYKLTVNAMNFDSAGTYMCVVTGVEIEGMKTDGNLKVHVTGPPEILSPDNTELQETYGNTVNLNCDVRGFPAPIITWHTADGEMLKAEPPTVTKDGFRSVVRFEVNTDITAVCNSSNEHGFSAIAYNIKALKAVSEIPSKEPQKESNGVIIAVIIICILLLAILGSVLYFLYKKGKICGRSGKQDLTKEKSSKDNIVVEMKSDNTEEAILLGVNGEKLSPSDQ